MDTYFASPHRTDRRKFKNQITAISQSPVMDTLLKAAAGILIVLNEDRQIVGVNNTFLKEMGIQNLDDVLELRLGETLHCIHADKKPNGCGTTQACVSCGAAIAMMTAIMDDKPDERICAILTDKQHQHTDICLQIKAQPIMVEENRWILIYAQDITQQQFWTNLEKVFFHDLNNIVTALYGTAQLLEIKKKPEQKISVLRTGIERLIQEISIQKALSLHKQEGLHVSRKPVPLSRIRDEIHLIINGHESGGKKNFNETWPEEEIILSTDPLFTSRVLSNMIINAFEASGAAETISLDTRADKDKIIWQVHNSSFIPEEIQHRIFQKHYSSKPGPGRGLGTYSMKLFGEKYLGGKVSFTSSREKGTSFYFSLPR